MYIVCVYICGVLWDIGIFLLNFHLLLKNFTWDVEFQRPTTTMFDTQNISSLI